MPRWRCVERCFWKNQFWSPFNDGKQEYEGDETPPSSKRGKPFFVCLDPPKPVAPSGSVTVEPVAPVPVPDPVEARLKDWQLKEMSKHDLLSIMETKYKTPLKEDAVTRVQLIEMVREKQAENQTNQDIANTVKG